MKNEYEKTNVQKRKTYEWIIMTMTIHIGTPTTSNCKETSQLGTQVGCSRQYLHVNIWSKHCDEPKGKSLQLYSQLFSKFFSIWSHFFSQYSSTIQLQLQCFPHCNEHNRRTTSTVTVQNNRTVFFLVKSLWNLARFILLDTICIRNINFFISLLKLNVAKSIEMDSKQLFVFFFPLITIKIIMVLYSTNAFRSN